MGPTAVGKTDLALRLANHLPIEIISVDSALIYQGMDIGSAKPSLLEQQQVPHHLIDIISPLQSYSVGEFLRDSKKLIAQISKRNKIPVLVGGTMMYYNALINGMSEMPVANEQIRLQIVEDRIKFGNQFLHDKLQQIDPVAANKIQANDTQRLERALEIFYITGKPISEVQKLNFKPGLTPDEYLAVSILPANRQVLHDRINIRFNKMLEQNFADEVRELQKEYPSLTIEHNSMRCVGYRQMWQYLSGEIDKVTLQETGQAATRQLAKRQITWLRALNNTQIIDDSNLDIDKLYIKLSNLIDNFMEKQ